MLFDSSHVQDFWIAVLAIVFLEFVHGGIRHMPLGKPVWFRWGMYYTMLFSILTVGRFGDDARQFIYFQF